MQDHQANDRQERPAGNELAVPVAAPVREIRLAQPGRPVALTASPGALDLVRSLRRRWLLALLLALAAAPGAAALAWYAIPRLLPVKRVVRTTLHVASQQPTISPLAPAEGRLDFATYQRTQIALVKSRLVLNAALRDPKVAGLAVLHDQANPTQWLESQLKVDYTIAPEILCISLVGENTAELSVLVEAVRDAYLREIVERQQHEQNQRLERLKEFYTAKEKIVTRRRQTLRGLAQAIGSNDAFTLARMQQYLLDRLGTAEKELMQLRSELRKAQVEDSVQASREKAAQSAAIPGRAIEEQLAKDPVIIQYHLDLAKREEELEKVKRLAVAADDPNIQRATAAVKVARQALASRREKLRPDIVRQLRENAGRDLEESAVLRRERVAVLKVLEQELNKEVKGLEAEVSRVKKGVVEVEAVRTELTEEEDLLRRLRGQVQTLTMELQAPSRVTILENITATTKPNRRGLLAIGAGVAGLALALLAVGWMEFRLRRVNGVHEVVDGLGIRLVGAIPTLPGRRSARQPKDGTQEIYYRNGLAESVDMTRAVLVRAAQNEAVRVVMITSALPGEGKTSLSCQLAASLAAAGFNTLLIDGDLRRPTVHRSFELDEGAGFNELLRGEANFADVVRQAPVPGLSVIGGGRWNAGTTRALARGRVEHILSGVRQQYDFILIDSSPVLPVADPLLIGQQADAVLFSVLRDVSRLPAVYAAYRRVQALGMRILGAVLSGAHESGYETSYQNTAEAAAKPA